MKKILIALISYLAIAALSFAGDKQPALRLWFGQISADEPALATLRLPKLDAGTQKFVSTSSSKVLAFVVGASSNVSFTQHSQFVDGLRIDMENSPSTASASVTVASAFRNGRALPCVSYHIWASSSERKQGDIAGQPGIAYIGVRSDSPASAPEFDGFVILRKESANVWTVLAGAYN